jgi:hypothetical protein
VGVNIFYSSHNLILKISNITLLFLIVFLILTSFIAFNNLSVVFDENEHLRDIKLYQFNDFSVTIFGKHSNAPGFGVHFLMGYLGKLLQSNNIIVYRSVVFISLLVLSIFGFIYNKRTGENSFIALSSLFLICNPYSFLCSASIMTEFISIAFVLPSVIILAYCQTKLPIKLILAFCIGLGIISRLYFIAAIPALFFMFNFDVYKYFYIKSIVLQVLFFSILCLPIFFLLYSWGGISPPMQIRSGDITNIGISPVKPFICVCYIGYYVSFLFLSNVRKTNIYILAIAIFVTICIHQLQINVWNYSDKQISTGIIYKAINYFSNAYIKNAVSSLLLTYSLYWGITFFKKAIFNLLVFSKDSFYIFSVFFLIFFVFEQFLIGGTIPFYERYLLVVSIFYGYVTIKCLPSLNIKRALLYFTVSFLISLVRAIYYHYWIFFSELVAQ